LATWPRKQAALSSHHNYKNNHNKKQRTVSHEMRLQAYQGRLRQLGSPEEANVEELYEEPQSDVPEYPGEDEGDEEVDDIWPGYEGIDVNIVTLEEGHEVKAVV